MNPKLSINDLLLMDSELAVKWNDEKESYIPLKLLRDHCPCAYCSGETDAFGNIYKGPKQNLGETSYKAMNMEKVGHYALRIFGVIIILMDFIPIKCLENWGIANGNQT